MEKLKEFLKNKDRGERAKIKELICKHCDIAKSTYSRKLNNDGRTFSLLEKEKIETLLQLEKSEELKQEDNV